jgi:hypothetical protein
MNSLVHASRRFIVIGEIGAGVSVAGPTCAAAGAIAMHATMKHDPRTRNATPSLLLARKGYFLLIVLGSDKRERYEGACMSPADALVLFKYPNLAGIRR